jgi:hypothetical protein
MLIVLPTPAFADPPEAWGGGKLGAGVAIGLDGAALVQTQLEIDGRVEIGPVALRADLDAHLPPGPLEGPFAAPTVWPPEVLALRVGRGVGPDVRAGVLVPELGIEGYDPDQNDFASFSLVWGLENGQLLGGEPGLWLTDQLRLSAFGGQDLAWGAPIVGGGLSGAIGAVETWSGGFWLPTEAYWLVLCGNRIAVTDEVWINAELDAGGAAGRPMAGGQLGLTFQPGDLGGAIRIEHQQVDREWLLQRYDIALAARTAMAADVRLWLRDAWGVVLEERVLLGDEGPSLLGTVLVTVRTPGEPTGSITAGD